MLRDEGVRRFRDGTLEVEFAPPAPPAQPLVSIEDLVRAATAEPPPGKEPPAEKSLYDDDDLYAAVGGRPRFDDESPTAGEA